MDAFLIRYFLFSGILLFYLFFFCQKLDGRYHAFN